MSGGRILIRFRRVNASAASLPMLSVHIVSVWCEKGLRGLPAWTQR
jgi:hypothetical protein